MCVFVNKNSKLLVCKRTDNKSWQFPQGGLDKDETYETALYREVKEEIGVSSFTVSKKSNKTICYNFPSQLSSAIAKKYSGQEQIWFLCHLNKDENPDLAKASCDEFCDFTWKTSQDILSEIIYWKKNAYIAGLRSLGLINSIA